MVIGPMMNSIDDIFMANPDTLTHKKQNRL
jgi:hypothetical protein